MLVIESIAALQTAIAQSRSNDRSVGFVPTMGALHEGHLSLVRNARADCDIVVVSIFVNPTQFNNQSDLVNYPRQLEADLALLEPEGCSIVFAPSADEMYPDGTSNHGISYRFGSIATAMEGAHRPGHFEGVAAVVTKLFDAVKPDRAYFGEKDFQQLAIIREMTRQGGFEIDIVGCPIVREEDGLAMSSRNQRLTTSERNAAPFIYRTLLQAARWKAAMSVAEIKGLLHAAYEEQEGFELEYFEIADASTLQPIAMWEESTNARAFVATNLGAVRLIDNIAL